mgnify:CR=1 FL=1
MNVTLENITQSFITHDRKIAAAISIILIILISLSVADSVLTILEAASPPTTNPKTSMPNQPINETIYKVSDLELFGKLKELRSFQEILGITDEDAAKMNLEAAISSAAKDGEITEQEEEQIKKAAKEAKEDADAVVEDVKKKTKKKK